MELTETQIENWLLANPSRAEIIISKINKQKKETVHTEEILFDIAKKLTTYLDVNQILDYVLRSTVNLIRADKCSVFLMDQEKKELYTIAFDVGQEKKAVAVGKDRSFKLKLGQGIVGTVAQTKIGQNIPNVYENDSFNPEMDIKTGYKTKTMMCFPIMGSIEDGDDYLIGVSCLINKIDGNGNQGKPFTKDDENLFKKLLLLVGLAIKNANLYAQTQLMADENLLLYELSKKETEKNLFLLDMAKKLSAEVDTTNVMKNILESAKKMISSDIATLYLTDKAHEEGTDFVENRVEGATSHPICFLLAKDAFKFQQSKNVNDVSSDNRFDETNTNYKTKSLLAVPCFGPNGSILGIAVLVNKRNHETNEIVEFTEDDQEMLGTFSIFCGLTLHKAFMFDEIKIQQQKTSIVMELMSFHAQTKHEEVDSFLASRKNIVIERDVISKFSYDAHVFDYTDDILVAISINLFTILNYDIDFSIPDLKLVEYILTVRRNYRPVAYHNFGHAASVTHTLYLMIINGALDEYLDRFEMFSMLIAALNHDIDHRGTNNAFQKTTGSVLASFYASSTMERHHFNHAMTILNSSSGLNILENLDNACYKRCLEIIEHSILATDLALFFGIHKSLVKIVKENTFSKTNPEHILLLRSIVMTCSDLGAMTKPFENAQHSAFLVYEEFFQQGDAEKKMGIPYSSELTDRSKASEIPRMQVGFYNSVVIPAFSVLNSLLGDRISEMCDNLFTNLEKWKLLQDSGFSYQANHPFQCESSRQPIVRDMDVMLTEDSIDVIEKGSSHRVSGVLLPKLEGNSRLRSTSKSRQIGNQIFIEETSNLLIK